jgi:hypothetical protein
MNEQNIDQKKYCSALCYYLNHIKIDLSYGRLEFLRSCSDHIGAMMSGYITPGKKYSGDWETFKQTCYASKEAYEKLQVNWNTNGLHMEHVVPIREIGNYLLKKHQLRPLTCNEILDVLKDLLIPCLITNEENKLLSVGLTKSMPKVGGTYWEYDPILNNQWDRYKQTRSYANPSQNLYSEIVALKPPAWLIARSNFPPPISSPVPLPWAPNIQIHSCDCLNSLASELPSGCMRE